MIYAIFGEDHDHSLAARRASRGAHLERIEHLKNEGRLIAAGPHPAVDSEEPGTAGYSGSLVLAEFPSLAEAERWAHSDPYVRAGVYRKVTVKPFRLVLP